MINGSSKYLGMEVFALMNEHSSALEAILASMAGWGKPGKGDHDFHIWKLDIESIFFLAFPLSLGFWRLVLPVARASLSLGGRARGRSKDLDRP